MSPRSLLAATLLVLSALAGPVIGVVPPTEAQASTEFSLSSGAVGFDISYPQCNGFDVPTTASNGDAYQFAIVGVNGGRAFTTNPCLAAEYQSLSSRGLAVGLYMNVNAPRGQSSQYAMIGPRGTCDPTDLTCQSYNYGWNAAQYAFGYAQQELQSVGISFVPNGWWLDVEIMNYWSRNTSLNDQVIQGAISFLQGALDVGPAPTAGSNPPVVVGIYSSLAQWNQIAGPSFQPDVPGWIARAQSLASANLLCGTQFVGGSNALVQFWNGPIDEDYLC